MVHTKAKGWDLTISSGFTVAIEQVIAESIVSSLPTGPIAHSKESTSL